jgi:peptide/nickel transport system permease protein
MATSVVRLFQVPSVQTVWKLRWLRKRHLALVVPSVILVVIVGACYLGPAIGNLGPPSVNNLANANLPIGSGGHLLGTDMLGNDLLTRSLFGGRASFEIGFGSIGIGFIIGSFFGLIAGTYGGTTELVIMRIVDILLSLPALIIALAVASALGASLRNEIFAISFFTVPAYVRITRAQVLRQRSREFVLASRIMGGSRFFVAIRHIYPNVLPTLMTFFPLGVGTAMIVEAALSFLGLGIKPPQPSWGNMIALGQSYLSTEPLDVIVPSIFLLLTVTSLNLLAEQLRLRWAK